MSTITFYQPVNMLEPDGLFGNVTWSTIWTLPDSLRLGSSASDKITFEGSFSYLSSLGNFYGRQNFFAGKSNITQIERDRPFSYYNTIDEKVQNIDRFFIADNLNIEAYWFQTLIGSDQGGALDHLVAGDNVIYGSDFADVLIGGTGNDAIYGGDGDDTIIGGGENNLIVGGSGTNFAAYEINEATIIGATRDTSGVVKLRTPLGTDTLIQIDSVLFVDESKGFPLLDEQDPQISFLSIDELVTKHQTPMFNTNSGGVRAAIYEGPVNTLDFMLIDDTKDAVVTGTQRNDFIKLSNANSAGKAVDGGGGDDVVDGGVGSTFITGGGGTNTFFLDGRASGVSWSTITDFEFGFDNATIWGWRSGVSRVAEIDPNGGAAGFEGLTLHFENLLPSGASDNVRNADLNSITFTGKSLRDFGVNSLDELNDQIVAGGNPFFISGEIADEFGAHGYLYIGLLG